MDNNDNNDNISEISDNDKLSVDLNVGNNYDSGESLILEDSDSDSSSGATQFWLNDDVSLPSHNSDSDNDSVLNEVFEINEKNDPIYNDDLGYTFSLTDLSNNDLNNLMKYSLNNNDDDEQNEVPENNDIQKLSSYLLCLDNIYNICKKYYYQDDDEGVKGIKVDIELKYKKERTWSEFFYYYWVGLFNNLKHKRKYLEYCNKISNLKKKINMTGQKINVTNNITNLSEEGENINYFNIENYDTNNFKNDLFTQTESNSILTDIKYIFKEIDNLLIDYIDFMKNAKAPIGDFFHKYKSTKNDCFKISNIKENKIFYNARCLTEIRLYKNNIHLKDLNLLNQKFKQKCPKKKKDYKQKFKDDMDKDNEYIEKDKFLFYLKEWIKSEVSKQKDNNNKLSILNYCNRQNIYFTFIGELYYVYSELDMIDNVMYSSDFFTNNRILTNNISMDTYMSLEKLNKYINDIKTKKKYSDYRDKSVDLDQTKIEVLIKLVKGSFNNKDEFYMVQHNQNLEISKNKYFWTYRNKQLIDDIFSLIKLFNKFDIKNIDKYKHILEFVEALKTNLNNFMADENVFEKLISEWELSGNSKKTHTNSIFSEKEIWWFYFVYNSNLYYYNEIINKNQSCCFPTIEIPTIENNNDIEKGYLFDGESNLIANDEIINFLEKKKYLYHEIEKKRPKHPEFKWNKLEFNPDKLEYSKRQLRYRKYLIDNLNDELIQNQIVQINELNESLVRKHFMNDCIENIEVVLNELENIGTFMKEGVLLNEQLFFKLLLFGINVLIFIGQYFWDNHIKQSI